MRMYSTSRVRDFLDIFATRILRISPTSGGAFAIAVASLLAGGALQALVVSTAGTGIPFAGFFPAIAISSLLAGGLAGVFVSAGSLTLVWWAVMEPHFTVHPLSRSEGFQLGWLFLCALLLVGLGLSCRKLLERAYRRQQAINDNAAALNALLTNAPIGFAFFNKEHKYSRINQPLADINGFPVTYHIGRTLEELLPVNATAVGPVIDDIFRTGQPISNLEVNGETPAAPGEHRSWLTSFFPVFGTDGSVIEVGATVIEITDRKRAEAQLRTSEARFRGVFESGAVGFSIFDANTGTTLAVNDRLLGLTGHKREEFDLGLWDWRELTPAEHHHLDAAAVDQALAQGLGRLREGIPS